MQLSLEIPSDKRIYTVSRLTREIKTILESAFPPVWIEGEISNFKKHSSGHMYFVLKDENSQIPAVMWRSWNERLFFTPQDGMKVLAQGNITVYEKRGSYQFEALQIQPAGVGELQMAFEQLKVKLQEDGLFSERFKKPIPQFPETIGIVTSPTGAAIRDMISIFNRRYPSVQLILAPVRVQGEGAALEISQAIKDFNLYRDVDLLIIGRGGGSLEDLWPFNEEIVARSIHESEIPIISAVGHEIDFCIADFVADVRASTPSSAAELAVPNREELMEFVKDSLQKIYRSVDTIIAQKREKVRALEKSYALKRPSDIIKQYQQRVDDLSRNLEVHFSHKLNTNLNHILSLQKQIISLSPQSILKRGYSICFRKKDGKLIKLAKELKPGEQIDIQFLEGQVDGIIEHISRDKSILEEFFSKPDKN